MARKSKKITEEASRSFLHEILGIVSFTLGAFVFLCLFSYSPQDPSLNSAASGGSVHNFGGIVGSYLADGLLASFGLASFLVGGLLLLGTYLAFSKSSRKIRIPEIILLGVFLVMAAVLFQLNWGHVSLYGHPTLAGGLLGAVVGEQLRKYLSDAGSYLLVSSVGLLAFVWATKISLLDLLRSLKKMAMRIGQAIVATATLYRGRLEKWQERRREEQAAIAREQEREAQQATRVVAPVKINLRKAKPESEARSVSPPRPAVAPRAAAGKPVAPESGGDSPGPKIFQRVLNKINTKKDDQLTGEIWRRFTYSPPTI